MAAYSQWTLAIYAWNKEEMQRGVQYPGKVFWQQLLVRPPSGPPGHPDARRSPCALMWAKLRQGMVPCLSGNWPSSSKSCVK